MTIDAYTSPYLASLMYIVREDNHAFVIDPFISDLYEAQNLKTDMALLTHEHFDHISGVNYLKEKFNCEVLCSRDCSERLCDPRKNMSAYFDVFTRIPQFKHYDAATTHVKPYSCAADTAVTDEETLPWRGHTVRVIFTPGHTVGSVCYLLDDEYLFSGDTLFTSYETTTRFPSGSGKAFKASCAKLLRLDDGIRVLPGHFESFNLGGRKGYLKRIAEEK